MKSPKGSSLFNGSLFFKFTYFLFKFLGLSTPSIDFRSLERGDFHLPIFAYSKLGIAYNVALIGASVVAYYFCFQVTYQQEYPGRFAFDKIMESFQVGLSFATAIFIPVTFCARQRHLVDALRKMQTVMAAPAIRGRLNGKKTSTVCEMRIICFGNVVMWIYLATVSIIAFEISLFYHLGNILANLIINWTIVQYSMLVKLILKIVSVVNENLSDIAGRTRNSRSFGLLVAHGETAKEKANQTSDFSNLRALYLTASEASQSLSNFYALSMLLSVFHIFVCCILNAYYACKDMMFRLQEMLLLNHLAVWSWVLLHLSSLILLTKFVSQVAAENGRTRDIVHKCIIGAQNQTLKEQLTHFLLYLIDSKIKFSVYEFFTLDQSIILSIVGYMTTYLVIILQFEHSEK